MVPKFSLMPSLEAIIEFPVCLQNMAALSSCSRCSCVSDKHQLRLINKLTSVYLNYSMHHNLAQEIIPPWGNCVQSIINNKPYDAFTIRFSTVLFTG